MDIKKEDKHSILGTLLFIIALIYVSMELVLI